MLGPTGQRHPTSRWSGLPEDTRNLSGRLREEVPAQQDYSLGGPRRGLALAPPERGSVRSPPETWIPQCQAGADGSAVGALSLYGANKVFSLGKLLQVLGSVHKTVSFKASSRGCVIIYPRLSTPTCLSLLDRQMFTLFPPKSNAGLFINPRGFNRLSVRKPGPERSFETLTFQMKELGSCGGGERRGGRCPYQLLPGAGPDIYKTEGSAWDRLCCADDLAGTS